MTCKLCSREIPYHVLVWKVKTTGQAVDGDVPVCQACAPNLYPVVIDLPVDSQQNVEVLSREEKTDEETAVDSVPSPSDTSSG
jgi:ribosome-binding protein aMBF1 (putative translation factor)